MFQCLPVTQCVRKTATFKIEIIINHAIKTKIIKYYIFLTHKLMFSNRQPGLILFYDNLELTTYNPLNFFHTGLCNM